MRQEARKFALEAIDVQKAEMKLLGVMADWDAEGGVYRTLGESLLLVGSSRQTTVSRFDSCACSSRW